MEVKKKYKLSAQYAETMHGTCRPIINAGTSYGVNITLVNYAGL